MGVCDSWRYYAIIFKKEEVMEQALITPDVLIWARERADYTIDMLSDKLQTKVEKLKAWESGELKPTFKQAQALAQKLHIPFGYLFLRQPPKENLPIPDLRTIKDRGQKSISVDFRDLLNDMKRKQAWYREYAIENGEEAFLYLGKFSLKNSIEEVSNSIKKALNISNEDRKKCRNEKEYLKLLSDSVDELGVLVMRNSIVGANTHRHLSVDEFRGFAISDAYAPLIFINSSDANSAKIFTLVHELAHLWIDESGISAVSLDRIDNADIESFCNAVSAEVLVPKFEFTTLWNEQEDIVANINATANHFKVSTFVTARRALNLGFIEKDAFFAYYTEATKKFKSYLREEKNSRKSGGNYYDTARTRLGSQFSRAVVTSVLEGKTLYRDGGTLLNMNPSNIMKFAKSLKVVQ